MKWLKIYFIALFLVLGASATLWAQSEDVDITSAQARAFSDPKWQATIDQITAQTKQLLIENEKLSSEYDFLQQKKDSLKTDLEKIKAEIKQLESQKQKVLPASSNNTDESADALSNMAEVQKQIDALEMSNKDLEKQLADIQEKNRLWKIKLSTLENQKRDASLDANYKEAVSQPQKVLPEGEMGNLQAQLDKSLQNEKELTEALAKISAENDKLPQETETLKKQNRDLEQRLKVLKREIAAKEKQNEKMQKSAKKMKPKSQGVSGDLLKQKQNLETEVAKLTKQLDAVGKTVGESKEVLEKKRQLMDQIMHLDAENQELHAKIDALVAETPSK